MEKSKWLASANPLMTFIEEECSCETDIKAQDHESVADDNSKPLSQTLKDFYYNFKTWADMAGVQRKIQRNTLKRNLENLGKCFMINFLIISKGFCIGIQSLQM